MGELGDLLKSTREAKGFALDQVSEYTRIQPYILAAIENEDFDHLPVRAITRGLVRNYATYLGLSPDETINLSPQLSQPLTTKGGRLTPAAIEYRNISLVPKTRFSIDMVLSLLLVIAVIGGLGFLAYKQLAPLAEKMLDTNSTPAKKSGDAPLLLPTPTPRPTSTSAPTITPTPLYYTGVTILLNMKERSWLQILTDDKKAFEGVMDAGESRSWTAEKRIAIRAGNAGGVEVTVNGQLKGLMGERGQVVDQVWEKVE